MCLFVKRFEMRSIHRHFKNSWADPASQTGNTPGNKLKIFNMWIAEPKITGLGRSLSPPPKTPPGSAPGTISAVADGVTQAPPLPSQLWSWGLEIDLCGVYFFSVVPWIYSHRKVLQPSEWKGRQKLSPCSVRVSTHSHGGQTASITPFK